MVSVLYDNKRGSCAGLRHLTYQRPAPAQAGTASNVIVTAVPAPAADDTSNRAPCRQAASKTTNGPSRCTATVEREFEGRGYGDLKTAVGDEVAEWLAPVRERYHELRGDEARLEALLGGRCAARRRSRAGRRGRA